MTKLPSLKPRQVIKALNNLGFEKVRQKGSHAIYHHPNCHRVPIPIHPSKTVNRYVLAYSLKQLDISEDDFLQASK